MKTKSIIIVGAGPGIGMGVAEKFGKEGYSVGLISRSTDKLKKLQQELSENGIHATFAKADAGNSNELKMALDALRQELGNVEVVHYNAAVLRTLNVLDHSSQELLNDLNVGIVGAATTIQEMRNDLKANNGSLLLTGGGFSEYPMAAYGSVSLAKAGIKNLTKQLHEELKNEGIYVGSLSVNGMVSKNDPKYNPSEIANEFYKLSQTKNRVLVDF